MTAKVISLLFCVLLILSLLILPNEAGKKKGSRYFIRIVRFVDCPGEHPASFSNVTQIAYARGAINALLTVQEDLPSKQSLLFEVTKCRTLEDASCEPYLSGILNWCKFVFDKGQFYSPLFTAFHPPLSCPIKKGTYEMRNGTMSYEAMEKLLKYIPPEYHQVYWRSKLQVTPPGRPEKIHMCFYLVFKYYNKRTR